MHPSINFTLRYRKVMTTLLVCLGFFCCWPIMAQEKQNRYTLQLKNGQQRIIEFYGPQIFRVFQDPQGGQLRNPQANPPAQILVDQPHRTLKECSMNMAGDLATIQTESIILKVNLSDGRMEATNRADGRIAFSEKAGAQIGKREVSLTLTEAPDEYFYGGGVQNGRFSHKGQVISIVNQNSWTDGGVCSPCPFYWSTKGYGVMFHTFRPGSYDFGSKEQGTVKLTHQTDYLDCFVMIDNGPVALLRDYYQLTGAPVLLPKFGFYEGHLNAYNRDYWKETDKGGVPFEDGKRYSESQKDNGGIKESLNGEKNNYQFSARAVIDRYKAHDMPLGWILPNDGYGAGYGQTGTLDGNVNNLKEFGDYARKQGVEIGLWTQSDLHPKEGIPALLQRDIVKEIGVAGVRLLKTDVAWVGAGYSFGLNGIADAANLMTQHGNNARPFIITLDGWAGTQRYAGVWSGDQTGGKWEYIRFHIPTYIGSGLAGMPNITSDMDGIFGGKDPVINVRDFQWKTFTPMQLNMDGWGSNEKYPHALGEPATSINRNYLKLKSALMPYLYSVAELSVDSLPMIRAMFLEETNAYTLGRSTQYQYMMGPWFLVAPIYQNTQMDEEGNDLRNGIYLPKGKWIDYFNGDSYEGGIILNNFDTPIWKLPVFVKAGAIIPMTNPNNNPSEINTRQRIYELYPHGESAFTEYDDDGKTQAYLQGECSKTQLQLKEGNGTVIFTILPTEGQFNGMEKERSTLLRVNVTAPLKKVKVKVGRKNVKVTMAKTRADFDKAEAACYYDAVPELNTFSTPCSDAAGISVRKNPQMLIKLPATDITANTVTVSMTGYEFTKGHPLAKQTAQISAPQGVKVAEADQQPYSLTPSWNAVSGADYYEIQFDGMIYSGIQQNKLIFTDLQPSTDYSFRVRAVNKAGASDWTDLQARTSVNPLEFAIQGITGTCSAESQPGNGLNKLFDFDEQSMWHSHWEKKATPFEIIADLHSVNTLERMVYVPRQVGVNGMITSATIATSMDKNHWVEAGSVQWTRDMEKKTFTFSQQPQARYIRIKVDKAYGDFGSGQELYVFKMKGSASYIPGDINNDKTLDENDLTSYLNYTGLRLGDKDFEGYVSKGDINGNGLIDAYDISNVAVEMEGRARPSKDTLSGKLVMSPDKKTYKAGETAVITVRGFGLKAVNALSFALAYVPNDYEYLGCDAIGTKKMQNYTNDRLHSNGTKSLYPTFVNIGNQATLEGSEDLFTLKFKVKKAGAFTPQMTDGILVDKALFSILF